MDNNLEELFNEDKLKKAIRKGKLKSTIRTIIISLVVTLLVIAIGSYLNTKISLKLSEEAFKQHEELVKLTVPNGYISESIDTLGFLGGKGAYKISRVIGNKPVEIQENVSVFGYFQNSKLLPFLGLSLNYPVTRYQGGYNGNEVGPWSESYTQTGYRKMMFFHPEINYKGYKNDLNELDKISDDKIIELAISFDKPYKLVDAQFLLGKIAPTWYWLDAYTKEDMKMFKKDADMHAGAGAYIDEFNAIGVNVKPMHFDTSYNELLITLQNPKLEKYNSIYNEMMAKGYRTYSDVSILGCIVYGTKSQLKELIGNTHIKASSFGVITTIY
ncbi:sigma factor regulator N-terminal domain-containing protein [Candidatus Clostridium stratigraminis]|uniref:Sigma factor regulator N-terminal domain-containing protein n=1 Tax=Candidatus Clostridium stratigraminis TaxID=3381661 RepID=A0ABW8T0T0_9CLOT